VGKKTILILIVISVLLIDQLSKIWVKTHILYGDGFDILGLSWAKIHFIENEGMAFGISYGGETGKYALSIFRILMVGFLLFILRSLYRSGESLGLMSCFSLIIAGAVGNILDSMFYGLIFSESFFHGGIATIFPEGGGYGKFLTGKVVDMFYFPLFDFYWPEWVPLIGGDHFEFFRPVFNVADSSIFVGVVSILLFHRRFFKNPVPKEEDKDHTPETANTTEHEVL